MGYIIFLLNSSNFEKAIMSPVCLWDDVVCRIYKADFFIVSASERKYLCLLGMYMRYPFWCCGIQNKIPQKRFFDWWRMFNAFVSTCEVAFCTTHGNNKSSSFDTESFVPVGSLCGIVDSLSWFTNHLIGWTGNILSVVYINKKIIYLSEARAYTIIGGTQLGGLLCGGLFTLGVIIDDV